MLVGSLSGFVNKLPVCQDLQTNWSSLCLQNRHVLISVSHDDFWRKRPVKEMQMSLCVWLVFPISRPAHLWAPDDVKNKLCHHVIWYHLVYHRFVMWRFSVDIIVACEWVIFQCKWKQNSKYGMKYIQTIEMTINQWFITVGMSKDINTSSDEDSCQAFSPEHVLIHKKQSTLNFSS